LIGSLITSFSGEIEDWKRVFSFIVDKEIELEMAPYTRELDKLDDVYDQSSRFNRFTQVLLHCLRRVEEENNVKDKVEFLMLAIAWLQRFSTCTQEERPLKQLIYIALLSELNAQPNLSRHMTDVDQGE
jgi:hypothetical protein